MVHLTMTTCKVAQQSPNYTHDPRARCRVARPCCPPHPRRRRWPPLPPRGRRPRALILRRPRPLCPRQITKTIWGAFPVSQDRVCITLDNQIVFNDLNKDMAVRGPCICVGMAWGPAQDGNCPR